MKLSLCKTTDFERLGILWRDLEARADASFFQSWDWTGCLAEERFRNPIVLEARDGNRVVALALFNQILSSSRRSTLCLGESGNPERDDIFIEKNGILVERGTPAELLVACLETARRADLDTPAPHILRLSGVDEKHLVAVRTCDPTIQIRTLCSPSINLEPLRRSNTTALQITSRNTRYQIRRSERKYAAFGPLQIKRAENAEEAQSFLTELARLHQRYWRRRGRPGAFANSWFERFHRALINRAFQSGGTDLLQLTAGPKIAGYLYNFVFQGHVSAYQSGFDYDLSDPHLKPGLTAHHLAIEMYLREGARSYDFLAGADRYKVSLSTTSVPMHWIESGRTGLPAAFIRMIRTIRNRLWAC